MKKISQLILTLLVSVNVTFLSASSHREAPLIANDPLADNTDVYAFRSPDATNTITLIANYVPLQLPQGGPNYYQFGENIRYEIHVDNNIDTPGDDIIYRFTFSQTNEDPTTFFNIRLGAQNLRMTYTLERSTDGGSTFNPIIQDGIVPPNNIGPRSIESPVGLGAMDYASLMQEAITTASTGETVYCGPADDPFFVDLGGVFDLGDSPRQNGDPRDGVSCFNVSTIAIQVPIATLQKEGKSVDEASTILDPDYVIGVWASASRPAIRTLGGDGTESYGGDWVQVSRLGMPLTNEAVIPIGDKDEWNFRTPYNENPEHFEYFYNPELGLYMDDDLFGGAVPAFSPLRIQRNSLGAFDFGNGQNGLFGLKGDPALDGTALDDAIFGTLLLPDEGKPRSVDLWPTFHTGVPNLAPYQLATGKEGNPLANGKPFIHNFLPNGGDMLRLNMATPVTDRNDEAFSSLGLVQAAVLGLTDPIYANPDIQFIPNMDGFPNGRRLEDDVTRIELQAVSGVVLAAIGLWYDDFDPNTSTSPVTQDLLDVLTYTTGIESNDADFQTQFPYVALPWSGTGKCGGEVVEYTQPDILPPTTDSAMVTGFVLVNSQNEQDILTITDGLEIDVNTLQLPNINIRANVSTDAVESVRFTLNGRVFRTENVAPYALGGDNNGNYLPTPALRPGQYVLTATPYSQDRAQGDAGKSLTVTFSIIDPGQGVTDFTLVNARTNQDVGPIGEGDEVDRAVLPAFSIRANITPGNTRSVVFTLNGTRFRTENVAPYALGGDVRGNYTPLNLGPGTYTLTATPYSQGGGSGNPGRSQTITFTVIWSQSQLQGVRSNLESALTLEVAVYPNPTSDFIRLDPAEGRAGDVSIRLYNALGMAVRTDVFTTDARWNREVDITDLPTGTYFIEVVNEGYRYSGRIVKQP